MFYLVYFSAFTSSGEQLNLAVPIASNTPAARDDAAAASRAISQAIGEGFTVAPNTECRVIHAFSAGPFVKASS